MCGRRPDFPHETSQTSDSTLNSYYQHKITTNHRHGKQNTQYPVDSLKNFSSEFNTQNRKLFLRKCHFSSKRWKTFPQGAAKNGKVANFSSEAIKTMEKKLMDPLGIHLHIFSRNRKVSDSQVSQNSGHPSKL